MKGLNKSRALILLVFVAGVAAISILVVGIPSNEGDMADAQPDQRDSRGFNDGKPNPKIQPSVNELSFRDRAQGAEAAEDFARERDIDYAGGRVSVVLESATSAAEASSVATAAGANVQAVYGNLVQVSLPVANIDRVAASTAVAYIREPERPTVFATSEGVADIGAQAWQAAGQTGAGVKIAVLDPGFSGYQQRVASGDLPANVITTSFRSDGDITGAGQDHGTACAELVYDVAPGAQLYLVNFSTDVELGNAVNYLTSQGVQVVSASWGFFGSFRGDGQGPINDMVAQARQAGITWANAAGNTAQQHWSGAWADNDNDTWIEFTAGDETNSFNIQSGARVDIYLSWDKWPATDQDYDLYLVWEGQPNRTVAASDRWQSGSQSPTEEIHYTVPQGKGGNYWIAIKKYSAGGSATFNLYALSYTLEHRVAAGSLAGQPTDSPNAMTVGAVAVNTTALEDFSSQGPTADGRIKPDIVAPDRVTTATYGSGGFWGTSASAPYAAGAAALVKGLDATYDPASIQGFLESRATDIGGVGKDYLYGSGKLSLGTVPALCEMPQLTLGKTSAYWASYADYISRELSVTYSLCNDGTNNALSTTLTGSKNTNNVALTTPVPAAIGNVGGGSCASFTVKYLVPPGVQSFLSVTYVNANDPCNQLYSYPAPYPEV